MASVISTSSSSDDGSSFEEEEFVGPALDLRNGGDDSSSEIPSEARNIERSPFN